MTDELLERHRYRTPQPGSFQSQHGEDRWLDDYFKQKKNGFFVEVGAYDGIVLSNTFHFELERGWRGILVEPDPRNAELCRINRPHSRVQECAAVGDEELTEVEFFVVENGEVYSTANLTEEHRTRLGSYGLAYQSVRVPANTLNRILEEASPSEIDFISIDVEEGELDVLRGLDITRWKPKLIIVESNGPSRKPEIRDYFVRSGYVYLHSLEINDFYVPLRGVRLLAPLIDRVRYGLAKNPKPKNALARSLTDYFVKHFLWRFTAT